jgi:hypothetical protein
VDALKPFNEHIGREEEDRHLGEVEEGIVFEILNLASPEFDAILQPCAPDVPGSVGNGSFKGIEAHGS